ncbi:MAG TPA: polysaccharide biosynthesis protein, partial [Stenomitos sp.]
PKPQLIPCIADLRSVVRLEYIFSHYQPETVFHAAAHKHVPLMELNPSEAVTNNIQGTKNLLELSQKHNVERFVMISTDKAVNPTSIMGATKRVAELLVLQAALQSKKPFVVVRFGNVLGSRGSVIPTFQRQIEAGGPVTVTHPQMCRYFMTIPEAVQLVLQAAVSSHEGQIFMLNMGQPVKIVDLAKDLIRLSGYEVGKDIDIVFSGMRPGEKLFEELLVPGENYEPTSHEKLLVVKNATQHLPEQLMDGVNLLCSAAAYNNDSLAGLLLEQLVTGYTPKRPSPSDSHPLARTDGNAGGGAVYHDLIQLVKSLRNAVKPDYCLNGDDLEQAILRKELHIFYQPIMLLESDHIVTGFEALLRWHHPLQGLMPSAAFLPFAEEKGIINTIGWWGLQEVCRQLKNWQHQFRSEQPITISVNLSHHQLLQRDLIPRIDEILRKTGVNTDRLRLEIPEGFIEQAPDVAIPILLKLKGLGLHLQVDNFGYSNHPQLSASYDWLHIFDSLKIDRSRVQNLGTDQGSIEFFRSALEISQKFGIELIATGIETPSQVMKLKTLNFKYGQGYFFLEPVSGDAVQALMSNGLTVT